jgi:hypothetical protein
MGFVRGRCWFGWVAAIVLLGAAVPAFGLPAFARKYNLRCSDCHEAWPKLNNFGQTFKDNGYQLMTGRDAPIYQQISYFPIAFRITPVWHRESSNRVAVDIIPGDAAGGQTESTSQESKSGRLALCTKTSPSTSSRTLATLEGSSCFPISFASTIYLIRIG